MGECIRNIGVEKIALVAGIGCLMAAVLGLTVDVALQSFEVFVASVAVGVVGMGLSGVGVIRVLRG
jgi:hypothetical protein